MDFDLKEVTEDPETEALLEAVSTTGGCRLLNVFVLGSDLVLTSTFDEEQRYALIKCRPGTQFYVLPKYGDYEYATIGSVEQLLMILADLRIFGVSCNVWPDSN